MENQNTGNQEQEQQPPYHDPRQQDPRVNNPYGSQGGFQQPYQSPPPYLQDANGKKILAGVLAIVLGHLGIHKFVLGYNNEGIIMLVLGLLGYVTACFIIGYFILLATGIIGLIEGIIYLTRTDQDFFNTYIKNRKPWF